MARSQSQGEERYYAATITLSDGPLVQMSTIVNDDVRTAKYLWSDLDRVYRLLNTQMVINIEIEI